LKLPIQPVLNFNPNRRRFVQGIAAGGVLASFPMLLNAESYPNKQATRGTAPVLTGQVIDLTVAESLVNFTGVTRQLLMDPFQRQHFVYEREMTLLFG